MDGDIVSEILKGRGRKMLVLAFDLLQADDVGPGLGEPGLEPLGAGLDAVDVPGGNKHCCGVPALSLSDQPGEPCKAATRPGARKTANPFEPPPVLSNCLKFFYEI